MRKPQSRDWGFVVYGILAVKYLESSTVNQGGRNANSFALWLPDGLLPEEGNPIRQKRQERFHLSAAIQF